MSDNQSDKDKEFTISDLGSSIVATAVLVLSIPLLWALILALGVWAALVFPAAFFMLAVALILLAHHIEQNPFGYLIGSLMILAAVGLLSSYLMYAPDWPASPKP